MRRQLPYTPHALDLLRLQILKALNDEGDDSDNDSKFAAFAVELDSDWYDLITHDLTLNCLEFLPISSIIWNFFFKKWRMESSLNAQSAAHV